MKSWRDGKAPRMKDRPRPDTAPGVHEAVLSLLQGEPRGKILDMGCWEGALSLALQQRGFEVLACDIARYLKVPNIPWKQWDLNSSTIPYEQDFFDYVALVEALEHLENPHQVIRAIRRILKPEGKLILTTPNILSLWSRIRFASSGWFAFFYQDDPTHINPVPFWELERILTANGFAIEAVTTNRHQRLAVALRPLLRLLLKPRDKVLMGGSVLIVKARRIS